MARKARERQGPGAPALLFEFCVKGIPVSWRAGRKNDETKRRLQVWRNAVVEAARSAAAGTATFTGPIDVEIAEFSEQQRLDRDNMAKPILDVLQGILFEDDGQVSGLHVEWCNIEGSYKVRYMPLVVAAALSEGSPFVLVRIFRHRPRLALDR